jgi:hypothetical protein
MKRTPEVGPHPVPAVRSRREFLERVGAGFGTLALAHLMRRDSVFAAPADKAGYVNPLAPKAPHFPAKAKSIIFLFMHGGASHLDTFDPKPLLNKLHGQLLPPSLANLQLQFTKANEAPIMGSPFKFQKHGQSGIEVSELFPNVARHVDDLAVIRSCHHDGFTHSLAMNLMLNGSPRLGFPSVGAWTIYGLGSENENLPAFIVMLDGGIKAGPPAYGSGFLPAVYQGTVMRTKGAPFLNITPPARLAGRAQRELLDRLKWHNERHLEARADDSNLSARIASYELAFRLQTEAPALADLSKETEATEKLYGIDQEVSRDFGLKCLFARRLVEQGVRFIQLYSGTSDDNDDWDTHARNDEGQRRMSRRVDKPIAGLLQDLKQRGLLDETLVVWGGDFGRTPVTDGNLQSGSGANGGRDHNPYGFTMWLAGGGVKGGQVIGATDELGFKAVEDPFHVHDFHATLLELMGLDHRRLTYFFQGRNFRLTDVHGDHPLTKRLLA